MTGICSLHKPPQYDAIPMNLRLVRLLYGPLPESVCSLHLFFNNMVIIPVFITFDQIAVLR